MALDISLREMELLAAGASQVRSAVAGVLGFVLTIDALFLARALDQGMGGGELAVGILALLALVMGATWGLLPQRGIVAWPDPTQLLSDDASSLADETRVMTIAFRTTVTASQERLTRLTRQTAALMGYGGLTVALWAWLLSQVP